MQFYEYKRRFQTHGIEGLKDLPPIPKSHPVNRPPQVAEHITASAPEPPSYGCNRLESFLLAEGIRFSFVTIQNILSAARSGSRSERWLALTEQHAETATELFPERIAYMERQRPCFRECHVESSRPGELLCQDTFRVDHLKGVARSICIPLWTHFPVMLLVSCISRNSRKRL